MDFIHELDVTPEQHHLIRQLRNDSFVEHQATSSYLKQLPHVRVLEMKGGELIGYMGLDYRVISVDGQPLKVLGVIDFCVEKNARGQGIGRQMLQGVEQFARTKQVDFVILISDLKEFYLTSGYQQITATQSWLRIHQHRNYGVAVEELDELYVKPMSEKPWPSGHVDWLGYMF
ncbi:acetyltransferase [Vibrio variabilis]|uniref:Acetyltransferase n=1 Tax=Vibrio variabilis TaxID=990271 RepID=A0ABR4YDD0_9VIBR|nr:GNAT family N-acetyltransferase [Vibrio variabilis]KHA61503.1 acetyltransferase [Vibrio variabilis]